jgi:hypothetical protein
MAKWRRMVVTAHTHPNRWVVAKWNRHHVDIIARTAFGDGPRRRVVPLKGDNDTAHDGGLAIAVIFHAPVRDAVAKVRQEPTDAYQRLDGGREHITAVRY